MITDWDICEKLSIDELNELNREIGTIEWHIEHLKTKLGELGFDMKSPLDSDSFIVPRLKQWGSDLNYFYGEIWELISKKEEEGE